MPQRVGLIIGRFSPIHKGHIHLFRESLSRLDKNDSLLVLIASSFRARSPKNPWTWEERVQMISSALNDHDLLDHRIKFRPIRDYLYNDATWTAQVANIVSNEIEANNQKESEVILFGFKKDESSYYLDLFPQWKYCQVEPKIDLLLNATDIRNEYFEQDWLSLSTKKLSISTVSYLRNWADTEEYDLISKEHTFYKAYRNEAGVYKYPITYVTVDSIIHYRNFVLLIERKAYPGKGLLALPGGFINQNERLIDAALRETREETGLRLRQEWLVGKFVADNPSRSLRGRTISHCFAFKYPDNIPDYMLPNVTAGDDASRAQWRHINDVRKNLESNLYEDHLDIINELWTRF